MLAAVGSARVGGKWQCPSHARTGDHATALRVGTRADGAGAWVYCHAGCGFDVVLRGLMMTVQDLYSPPPVTPARHVAAHRLPVGFPPPRGGASPEAQGYRFETEHPYGDPLFAWKVRHRRPTTGEKCLTWESLNPHGERVPGLLGRREVDLPLYRETDLRPGIAAGEPVVLVESESSADALRGHYATTWAGGASAPPLGRLAAVLSGADVVIVPDHDAAGLACLARLWSALPGARVLVPDRGEDARDLVARVGRREFARLVATADDTTGASR